jgi:hypothetical protein
VRLGNQPVDARADPGIEDGGDVAGSGQVPGCDGGADDLGRVQAGEFGGVQGAEQPPGLVRQRLAMAWRQRGRDQVAVAVVAGGLRFGSPERLGSATVTT